MSHVLFLMEPEIRKSCKLKWKWTELTSSPEENDCRNLPEQKLTRSEKSCSKRAELTKSSEENDCVNLPEWKCILKNLLSEIYNFTNFTELSPKLDEVVNWTENGHSSQNHQKRMIVRIYPNGTVKIIEVTKTDWEKNRLSELPDVTRSSPGRSRS